MKLLNRIFTIGGLLFVLLFAGSCQGTLDKSRQDPVARVFDNYLYAEDICLLLPDGCSNMDSTEFTQTYIDQWINKQLLLHHAEFNLDLDSLDFSHLIDDYRSSLLIHEYRKQLVLNKVDTTIASSQIEEYYTRNLKDFELSNPVVKALYIRIPKDNTKVESIRELLQSTNESSFEQLVSLSYQYADRFDFFEDEWVSFNLIIQKIPGSPDDYEAFLRSGALMEIEDENYIHFLQVHDYKLSNETAPLEYVRLRIRDLVLSERKMKYLKELEESVYQTAIQNNDFEIFDEK
ncbi:MAG: hypothetical protein KAH17_10545 [Bacteroidales bacterium]|nr:hypothetical protein [Bacteroidales bacterium]